MSATYFNFFVLDFLRPEYDLTQFEQFFVYLVTSRTLLCNLKQGKDSRINYIYRYSIQLTENKETSNRNI